MKKLYSILTVAGFILLLASCEKFDLGETPTIEPISATIKIQLNVPEDSPAPESYTVKLVNFSERFEITREMDKSGSLTINDIIPGMYTVTVSSTVVESGLDYIYNGNLVNINIVDNGEELLVPIGVSKSSAIMLKEIYFSGSKTPSGGSYFRDQFYEIYNNGDHVQYLDGLCIGNLNPNLATANIPNWNVENPEKYIYFSTIWQIPGNGTDYPLEPGESAIIAQMADNHQKATLNPGSPVNLITAEFETFVNTTSLISDNPAINMKMAFWLRPTPQWLVTVFGGAYAIFYPKSEIDPNDYVTPVESTTQAYKVLIEDVLDAVEIVNDETKAELKRVPAVLDAGVTFVGATYASKSVARKIKVTLDDGRVKYQDTNNSTEDFEIMDPPVIRRNNAKIPSWNTWSNL